MICKQNKKVKVLRVVAQQLVAAYDKEGKPTPALFGFAKSCGVDVEQLTRIQTDKGDWMVYETQSCRK